MRKMKVALQLYSVRDAAAEDFWGTLEQVKDMGYDHVEFTSDFFGHSASSIRERLDALNLAAISSHVPIDDLVGDLERCLNDYGQLGCSYIAVPWLDEARRPGQSGFDGVVKAVRTIGERCKNAGMTLLYHNHDFDFIKIGEEYALDLLYGMVPSEYLQTEIDTCWVKVAGVDPASYVRKYAGRSPLVHLKDFVMSGPPEHGRLYSLIGTDSGEDVGDRKSNTFDFRPLGQGQQDMTAIVEAASDAGSLCVVVEQDRSSDRSSLEAARQSRTYLRRLGL